MQRGLPMQPTVVLLREGTDTSQGKPQLLSNISACLAIADTLATTLGPRGMDKLIVNERGEAQITNDGATILKLLEIVHPAAKSLVDIARAQDAEVGDGTTSVVLLATQILKEVRGYIEEGVSPHVIMKGIRKASQLVRTLFDLDEMNVCLISPFYIQAVERIKELQVTVDKSDTVKFRDLLLKCAATSMSSKLIHSQKPFFSKMAVDAVLCLDQDDLDETLIGVKKIPGGGLQDSLLIRGVSFKKTFTYAGAEQQPKSFKDPLILCLNVELELKAEKDNAEVRVEHVSDYQAIVDAEWTIIYNKLELIEKTGAKVVLSKLPIGDLATQWFADRGIFCAGRVQAGDLRRVVQAVGGSIQSTCSDIERKHLGTCGTFDERQLGGERYNVFEDCPVAKTCTLLLRGGAEQFIEEVERSLHDSIMVVKRAVKSNQIVAGGGAIEMELSAYLRTHARTIPGKVQLIISAFAKALEIIPRQICDNAGLDSTDVLNRLRQRHASGQKWTGVDVDSDQGVRDNMGAFVWEPAVVKLNAIASASEAACLILSVDETVRNPQSEQAQAGPKAPPGAAQRALRGRGRAIAASFGHVLEGLEGI
ncbi:T-complex protein 1 subunit eta [Tulasnella sp. 331]|nr:T-complex protein 1 subunit eta [Tulasnella sp. 331]KAG8880515.1 T-complex protein 1 subunit eta [Tulasnella sp. 332]